MLFILRAGENISKGQYIYFSSYKALKGSGVIYTMKRCTFFETPTSLMATKSYKKNEIIKKYELGEKMALDSKSREMIFEEVTKGLYIDEMFHSNKHFMIDKISNAINYRKEIKKNASSYLRKLDNMLLFLKEVVD